MNIVEYSELQVHVLAQPNHPTSVDIVDFFVNYVDAFFFPNNNHVEKYTEVMKFLEIGIFYHVPAHYFINQ